MTIKEVAENLNFSEMYIRIIARQNDIGTFKLINGKHKRIFTHEDLKRIRQILDSKRHKYLGTKKNVTQVMGRIMESGLVKIYLHKNGMVYTEKHWLCTLEECREKGVEIIN